MRSRRWFPCVLLMASLLVLASCSASGPAPSQSGSSGAAFPVTIPHAFGDTTVEAAPTRVVALGVTDADALLALGITPVATAGYEFFESRLGPWATPRVQGPMPAVLESDSSPNLEQIAALGPDLIVAVSSGIDQGGYEQLSRIAPTVARTPDSVAYTVSRDDQTRVIARALGRGADGDRLVEQTRQAVAAARSANPAFSRSTGAVVLPFDGEYGAFTPGDARGGLLAELGFALPPAVASRDTGRSFFVELSTEQVGLLDGDVLVVLADDPQRRAQIEADRVFGGIPVVREGRSITADTGLRGALSYNSALSVPFALERLVPQLAQRVR